jgi:hypothetical protein
MDVQLQQSAHYLSESDIIKCNLVEAAAIENVIKTTTSLVAVYAS